MLYAALDEVLASRSTQPTPRSMCTACPKDHWTYADAVDVESAAEFVAFEVSDVAKAALEPLTVLLWRA